MVSRRKLILKSLERIEDIPTISAVYNEIVSAIDSDADVEKIGKLAKQDLALSVKVLKIVNSPVYRSLGRQITDVEEGVIRLGIMEFKKIVLSLSVVETFGKLGSRIDYQKFWRHSLTSAFLTVKAFSHLMGKQLGKRVSGELFTASILHDIGVIILDHYFPDYYSKVLDLAPNIASKRLIDLEQEALEITHEEVGLIVAERWNLPEHARAAIRYHHSIKDYQGKYEPIVRMVKIANEICIMQGFGNAVIGSEVTGKVDEAARDKLKEKSELYGKILSEFKDDLDKSEVILSII